MKRKQSSMDNDSSLSTRITKSHGTSNGANDVLKKMGWLKSIGTLPAIVPAAPAIISGVANGEKPHEEVIKKSSDNLAAGVHMFSHLPSDFVLRKSVSIEANFDLREFIQALRTRQQLIRPENQPDSALWKFEVHVNPDWKAGGNDTNNSKRSLQGDSLWLKKQGRSGGGEGSGATPAARGEVDSDKVRVQIVCWQEALDSLAVQFFAHSSPLFYVLGRQAHSFRAVFWQTAMPGPAGAGGPRYHCLLHRCTTGMFQDLRALGVPLRLLGVPGAENMPKSNRSTSDRIVLLSGSTAVRAVLDCISRASLPLASTPFRRVAADLPALAATSAFRHAVPSQCVPVAYRCTATTIDKKGGSSGTTAAPTGVAGEDDLDVDSFCKDYLQRHNRIRTLQLSGDMTASCIEELAVMLRKCGQSQSRRRNTRTAAAGGDDKYGSSAPAGASARSPNDKYIVNKSSFMDESIFRIDKNKLKAVDDFASGYTVQNPFQLFTSNPSENTTLLVQAAKKKWLASATTTDDDDMDSERAGTSERDNADETWLYFNMQLTATMSDFHFSIATTVDRLRGAAAGVLFTSESGEGGNGGAVVTDVAWYEEDSQEHSREQKLEGEWQGEDLFEVSTVSMPELTACSVGYSDE